MENFPKVLIGMEFLQQIVAHRWLSFHFEGKRLIITKPTETLLVPEALIEERDEMSGPIYLLTGKATITA